MKRSTFKKGLGIVLLLMLALALSSCSTRVGEHSNTYWTQMESVIRTAREAEEAEKNIAPVATVKPNENALATPANFTVSADGSYSFDAVANAQYYVVYVYPSAASVTASKQSGKIMEDGSAKYTGSLNDLGDFSYATWNVRVVAYPDYDNTSYVASAEARADYKVSGAVEVGNPTFGYMWTVTASRLDVKISDMNYGRTAYPTSIVLTLTNTADASDKVTINLTDISSSSVTGSTTAVKKDAAYAISADFTWDKDYVSNPTASLAGGEALTSSTENLISGEFYYSSAIFHTMDFPHVQPNFDPIAGGSAGVWYSGSGKNINFEATPIAAKEGAKYSYDVVITAESGAITATPKLSPGSASTGIVYGDMNIYDDGTFDMTTEYQYIRTDAMNSAVYYVPSVICKGVYTTNADGTINLSYDHENAAETDYDIVTELTGKAKELGTGDAQDDMGGSSGGGGVAGFEVEPTSISFAEGDTGFNFKIGSHELFNTTANLQATPDDGDAFTYSLAKGDPNAPFDVPMTLHLHEDGTTLLDVGAAGPVSATQISGEWANDGGTISVTWH